MLRRGVRPACVLLPNHLKVNGPTAGWYDRAPNISCTAWQFAPRERFTMVALLRFCGNGAPDDGAGRCPPEPWRAAGAGSRRQRCRCTWRFSCFTSSHMRPRSAARATASLVSSTSSPAGLWRQVAGGRRHRSSVAVVPEQAWRSKELRESCSNFVPQRAPSSSSSLRVRNIVSWLAGSQISQCYRCDPRSLERATGMFSSKLRATCSHRRCAGAVWRKVSNGAKRARLGQAEREPRRIACPTQAAPRGRARGCTCVSAKSCEIRECSLYYAAETGKAKREEFQRPAWCSYARACETADAAAAGAMHAPSEPCGALAAFLVILAQLGHLYEVRTSDV